MNTIEVIEALKIDKEYKEALLLGIQNIDEENAIEIITEMISKVLPDYMKKPSQNTVLRETLDLINKYRKNPTKLNQKKLQKAAAAAAAAAKAAAAAAEDVDCLVHNAASFAAIVRVAKYAYDDAEYEQFCCKYIDKMIEILKKKEEKNNEHNIRMASNRN